MKIKNQVPIGRVIGKVSNDFNISESDWIPRVAAWVIDALSQLNCLPMTKKSRELKVVERVATFPCALNAKEIEVYDERGCPIQSLDESKCNCNSEFSKDISSNEDSEIAVFGNGDYNGAPIMNVGSIINNNRERYFIIDGDRIELNFDTNKIIVKSYEVATYHDDYYDCDCPYVYDNGLLLEALAYYILFKYLSRGSNHPVFSIKVNNQVTNPYIVWMGLKSKAKASVLNSISKDSGWRNFFYNATFDPRNS